MKKSKSGLGRGLGAFGLGKNILAPEGTASPTPAGAKTSGTKKPAASAAKGKGSSVKNAGAASLHPAGSAGTPALISIERIQPNRFQPRREFDESALEELRESIAQHGILQPLIVRDIGGGTNSSQASAACVRQSSRGSRKSPPYFALRRMPSLPRWRSSRTSNARI